MLQAFCSPLIKVHCPCMMAVAVRSINLKVVVVASGQVSLRIFVRCCYWRSWHLQILHSGRWMQHGGNFQRGSLIGRTLGSWQVDRFVRWQQDLHWWRHRHLLHWGCWRTIWSPWLACTDRQGDLFHRSSREIAYNLANNFICFASLVHVLKPWHKILQHVLKPLVL